MTFRIEGSVCFAKVPPGFELEFELYDLYPDGSKNMLIKIIPAYLEKDSE